ncbi:GtrA family protein [Alicyclobacillus vulcanalis]|uniref:Putative flippase GtrA (Transmembrane translocase of bactoprenol-linked glucose) n=1 Tax=Alicyclobacillus vulcanalis TaxID=252246 RepID=A0A1N7P007_9BACL|nr:GtrA family protein [Alicyclobacillus vulcanalis]SIT03913.1 Putative flippase GtrA (transmembrane translocase of bactoprenol-linked glucose) [Alicyclobacillus vulcanalis]
MEARDPMKKTTTPPERAHGRRGLTKQMAVFGAVGVMNTAVDALAFFALAAWLHVPSAAAQVVSYACGMANSFVWNRGLTFRAGAFRWSELARFVAVGGLSMVLSAAGMWALARADWPLVAAKALVTLGTLCLNFVGSKWWVWRHATGQADAAL